MPGSSRQRRARPCYVSGSGTDVVLLHGLGMSWRAWRPVIPAVERHHRVVAPTLPGHYAGPVAPAHVSVQTLADRVCHDLDDLGVGRAHVVGNSLGGWLALELARRGRARSVTAFSPAGAWSSNLALLRLQVGLHVGAGLLTAPMTRASVLTGPARRMALRGLMEHGERVSALDAAVILRDMRECTVMESVLRMGARDGGLGRFDHDDCPIRIAWGSKDRTIPFPAYGRPLRELFPEAEFLRLPGAGHVPMFDIPDRVAELVLAASRPTDERSREGSR